MKKINKSDVDDYKHKKRNKVSMDLIENMDSSSNADSSNMISNVFTYNTSQTGGGCLSCLCMISILFSLAQLRGDLMCNGSPNLLIICCILMCPCFYLGYASIEYGNNAICK